MVVVGMAVLLFSVMGCGSKLTDRDGNTYRTVKIGNQIWMAENLKVRTTGSWCYNNKESNCQKYGRLYNWDAAKTACSAGWHLPSEEEFETLLKAVGGTRVEDEDGKVFTYYSDAGKKLKSTSGWKEYEGESGNGDDAFGFSALPAGYRYYNGNYNFEGKGANFWSSTEADSEGAYYIYLGYGSGKANLYVNYKYYGFSVRCLKD